jgi:Leucine-rich repeat (LRR) protein
VLRPSVCDENSDISGMVSLAHLDVSHNSLHHLAPQLSGLVALTYLEASDNKLHQSTAVPEELATLTALKVGGGFIQTVRGGGVLSGRSRDCC